MREKTDWSQLLCQFLRSKCWELENVWRIYLTYILRKAVFWLVHFHYWYIIVGLLCIMQYRVIFALVGWMMNSHSLFIVMSRTSDLSWYFSKLWCRWIGKPAASDSRFLSFQGVWVSCIRWSSDTCPLPSHLKPLWCQSLPQPHN